MAEGDAHVTNNFKEQLLLKQIDCDTDVFKMALFNVAWATTQIDGEQTYGVSTWATNECNSANYTAGGQSIGTPVVTQDDTNDWAKWDDDGTDVVWTSLGTFTIQTAILYDDTTTPKHVCIIWEIATNSNGGNYTLTFGANGIMTLA